MAKKSSNQHKGDSFEKLVFTKLKKNLLKAKIYLVYHDTTRFFCISNIPVKLRLMLC